MNLKYPNLFSPIKIGNITYKNRIFSAPISLQELSPELTLTQENIAFFELRAKGGAANVTVGVANVLDTGRGHTKELALDNPLIMPSLTHCARTIRRHGSIPSIELCHAGMFAGLPNLENPHPTNIPYGPLYEVAADGTVVRPWDEGMIMELVEAFANGARLVKTAGFEMLMVHAAHGWLLSQFISPTNTRCDQFGGSFENRMRFPVMVLKAIREAVGPGFPIEFRMNAVELFEEGHGLDEAIEIAKYVQEYVDIIHVSAGNQKIGETFVRTHPDMFLPHGVNVEYAAAIKKHVNIPVAVVGAITDPDLCEEIIASGKADIVEMARGLMADPFLPQKAMEGRDQDIRKCMRCHVCFDTIIMTRDTACALNPVIGEEELYFSPPAAPAKLKKVLVAGGGPGGMQAAITAAERGHNVILCEATDKLGGQILCEAHVDFKKNYFEFGQWLIHQLEQLDNVEIRLNTRVDAKLVDEIKPDALICALGSDPLVLDIPGIDDERVIYAAELAKENPNIGQKVVVIGAGLVGCESAIHFLREKKDVTLIECRDDFAVDANAFHKMALNINLRDGADIRLNTTVKAITKAGVVAVDQDGNEVVFPADTIFCAAGMKSKSEDVEALRGSVMEFWPIGDCVKPGKVQTAIQHGYYAALDL
ncbi:FAD-dependent oxidoreductase [Acetobacterium sp. KB-1]|jgi:2,4-dienoyl-CoA reductase-like NADH-dependent reductase (Old Yellow Enzyme family)/thioredoxin reductase|uniref:oxidoreductase n=1 Tax=Acetobacterium sp. KB-1 TaxID=2184575 RepID=UPI000DBEC91F|nr:FAD-dependent oxidoreductase [Acetobacterium sp. KB-1]AWW25862.1 enoate reductase [Acetobacterium sp. KB-1]